LASDNLALRVAEEYTGMAIAASIPTITTTTISSIRVKADRLFRFDSELKTKKTLLSELFMEDSKKLCPLVISIINHQ
jgi:hypothetical protein